MKLRIFALILVMTALVSGYSQERSVREELRRKAGKAEPSNRSDRSGPFVSPLLSTKWGEGCLYNENCPADAAATATCLHVPAGSGAIAMAQLMKYYGFPSKGTGEHGYTHPVYGIQYVNFSATTYQWSQMPDSLTTSAIHLATLIYHCGVAQDMNFGTVNSSSSTNLLDTALIKYFGYPKTAQRKSLSGFTATDWKSMLKAELDAGHPLLYSATNYNGTILRFFVIDGYGSDDTFHVNWGAGGTGNGNFTLYNLRFDTTNFSYNQQALFGLAPSPPTPTPVIMDFESTTDFSLTFGTWSVFDLDQHDTYGIDGFTFPHQNEPMAFLSFNPAATTPTMAGDAAIQPHGGSRFGACFSSNPPANNDWFISPQVQMGIDGSFSFWIKSYTDTYGLDSYRVAVSTTDNNPSSFTVISGDQPLQTTTTWTRKVFNLSGYNNQKIYVAIQCVSNDNFLMMIDDIEIKPETSTLLSAEFSANNTNISVGGTVNFTDQSGGAPTSWQWSFTGGIPSSSNEQNPSGIRYNAAGTYPVKLRISNGLLSDSLIKTGYIRVSGFPSSASLDFESLPDFTLVFSPWTLTDVGGGSTYGINGVFFPGDYDPMAYICFNPSQTTPPLTNMVPHSGQKLGCSFSSVPPWNPNKKWLISPQLTLGADPRIEFWVKTYNNTWGDEQFKVAVSVKGSDPSDFTPLQVTPEKAPMSWTQKSYSLKNYEYKDVYIGIQCVTDNGFIFMIDDITISSSLGVNDKDKANNLIVYPNPADEFVTVKFLTPDIQRVSISIMTLTGIVIKTQEFHSDNGSIVLNTSGIPSGSYIIKLKTNNIDSIYKLTVIH
jgi:PKD repeat protein